ncbi:MAG: LacI family transcriptional regulator [Oscillospiraceae bacterium]|jgi:LacI family transcriptional regulator|nr:LacI family transcriptional regulator [Oscillospiraceae bacterium]
MRKGAPDTAATIKDISRCTGLGLATISKYLNGGNVRPKNKLAIDQAIADLHYTANEIARGLKTRRSRTVGIVIPELSNVFITTVITAMEDVLRRRGYAILVCDCRMDADLERQAVRFLVNKGVDGLISMPVDQTGDHLQPAWEKRLPVVVIDRMISKHADRVDAVMVDNVRATQSAAEHLLSRGHRAIGIIVGARDIFTSEQRLLGCRQAMQARGLTLPAARIRYGGYTVQGGYERMKRLLAAGDLTGVLVTNYDMTLGAMIAINEMGVKMPQDISFIGFDNLQLSKVVRPRLTIVDQPVQQIGMQAATLVLARLEEDAGAPARQVTLQADLQLGESVADIR